VTSLFKTHEISGFRLSDLSLHEFQNDIGIEDPDLSFHTHAAVQNLLLQMNKSQVCTHLQLLPQHIHNTTYQTFHLVT